MLSYMKEKLSKFTSKEQNEGFDEVPAPFTRYNQKFQGMFRVVGCSNQRNENKIWILIGHERRYLTDFLALDDWGMVPYQVEMIEYKKPKQYSIAPWI